MLNYFEYFSLAQKILILPFLIIAVIGVALVVAEQNNKPANYVAYTEWNSATSKEQLAWINGAMLAAEYVAKSYIVKKGDPGIIELVPRNINAFDLQKLINNVYRYRVYRGVPLVDIVIRYKYWTRLVIEKLNEENVENDRSRAKA